MKTIYILLWIDAFENRMLVHMLGERQLNQDAVDSRVLVQLIYFGQQFFGRSGTRNRQFAAQNPELLTRLCLHVDVGRRSRVVTDQNHSQSGLNSSPFQGFHLGSNFVLDVVCDLRSVDECSGHFVATDLTDLADSIYSENQNPSYTGFHVFPFGADGCSPRQLALPRGTYCR